ncbi:uncharacterized protein EV420DRAFT_1501790 [Desarmillaria tabescens]|uniref:Uncharacterized protein n=1 Tax=Armillaria tabescens TaxID=1929756 RepID=A0AA39NLK5_ARMTA|nr:uncharacterized protein EV420DRAFT_1501790 [Desarmillaria tabescens]KAK0467889.1 hypothetical protein EV420DRAFT_1501790 [Desarmillaria tabescens]
MPQNYRRVPANSLPSRLLTKCARGDISVQYITHLDRMPIGKKRRIFFLRLLLAITLGTIILYRLCSSDAYYMPLPGLLGEFIPRRGPPRNSWTDTTWNYLIDNFLWTYVVPDLRRFFFGHVWLRARYGFRDVEIVFRKSTTRTRRAIFGNKRNKRVHEKALMRAIHPLMLSTTVGSETGWDCWKVDYAPVFGAYELVEKGRIPIRAWDVSLWARTSDGEWAVWQVWRDK